MDIHVTTQAIQELQTDALVVAAARKAGKDEQGVQLSALATTIDGALEGLLSEICTSGEFKGGLGELLTLHTMGRIAAKRVILIGLGSKVTTQSLRRASAVAARHLQNTGAQHITLALQWSGTQEQARSSEVQAEVEGALLGLYTFGMYKQSENASTDKTIAQLGVFLEDATAQTIVEQAIEQGRVLAEATNFARNLVNEPPNVLTPTELANRAVGMAQRFGLEYEVFDKAKITELKMGGILGVAQGSAEPPQFIVLRYRGGQETDKGLALVGKGITFDTGGISIKPAAGMDEMKGDMGGAAAVLGAMQAIAALKPRINVTALVPTCENMPSGTAYRPGDILRISNGKTIEIVNTDAEGRLILADALSYAVKEGFSPIVDLATLTGAIVIALGNITTGVFSNDEQLTNEIIAAGQIAGEKFWALPMDEEYGESIKSDIADIKQTGSRAGSSITAAKILEHFVGDTKWAHLDIAGTSYLDSKKPYQEKGATGVAVRTLAELARKLAL